MKQRYAGSDFTQLAGNKVVMDTESDYANTENNDRVDLDKVIQENAPFSKLAFGCVADNMRLPFADNVFEAYVSNLSLMIV